MSTSGDDRDGAWIGVATFTILTESASSLKDKRGMIAPIVERLRTRFPVSVARLAYLDQLGKERIGMVVMNGDPDVCRSVLDKAVAFVASFGFRLEDTLVEVDRWD